MRTEIESVGVQDESAGNPNDLWLDQSISEEDLIALDPLEEVEDLLAIAREATGDFIEGLPMRHFSSRVRQLFLRVAKKELQRKYGEEAPEACIRRLRGSR